MKTKFQHGHRWTMIELTNLMNLWQDNTSLQDIATHFHTTPRAIIHIVQRLRKQGVPLTRRTKGNKSGRSSKLWTQSEVEYLIRRREENASNEEISTELGRSELGVYGMIANLNKEGVAIAMRGQGKHRLYNVDSLKALTITLKVASKTTE